MKRLAAVLLVVILLMTFLVGCGKNRLLYNNVNLEDYISLAEYNGMEVDTNSSEFDGYFNEIIQLDIQDYELYSEIDDGIVADGDIVNLDYEGKIDGVAFSGGTAQGADLEIGSGTFIDDFEEELIGVAVGETKDVTATFPTPYENNPDLAGKEAVFTCKINSIKRPMTVEESYGEMDFDSSDDYYSDITERAAKAYILDKVCEDAKITEYPKKDMENLNEAIFDFYVDAYKTEYDVDLEELLIANGSSVDAYKSQISSQMTPSMMKVNMSMYYILDAENLQIDEKLVEKQKIDQEIIAESYAVQEIVLEHLYEKAVIK